VLHATGGRIAFPSSVFDELVNIANDRPRDALQAVQLMVRGVADEGWEIVAGRDAIRAVLVQASGGIEWAQPEWLHRASEELDSPPSITERVWSTRAIDDLLRYGPAHQ
jgi:hypothetical protein